jgi:SH3-like domain-containing protein
MLKDDEAYKRVKANLEASVLYRVYSLSCWCENSYCVVEANKKVPRVWVGTKGCWVYVSFKSGKASVVVVRLHERTGVFLTQNSQEEEEGGEEHRWWQDGAAAEGNVTVPRSSTIRGLPGQISISYSGFCAAVRCS